MILGLVDEAVASGARVKRVCAEIGIDSTTLQRWRRRDVGDDLRAGPIAHPANKLSKGERERVLEMACSPQFRDLSPNQIVPTLADQGEYIASESTFYRVLREEELLKHRGRAKAPVNRSRPAEKVATGPCQVWSWDITYLKSPIRGVFFYLYLIMDVWSRKIVGSCVHLEELSEHAAALIGATCTDEGVGRYQLILHSDNGNPMKGATMLARLEALGIEKSFSRPRVSDDNPYSESLFRTLKYCPEYPSKPFASLEAASEWVDAFIHWYNEVHLHSNIQFVTPADRHAGLHHEILKQRTAVYNAARQRNPDRWAGSIRNFEPTRAVVLNSDPSQENLIHAA